jgi:spermidine synthase
MDSTAIVTEQEVPLARRSRLWQPAAIVFISSACMMVLELVAGRIMAPYVGVSLYTWTGVIGVILAGMSLGNYLGGRLADRWASLRLLGGVFFLAGLLSAAVLAIEALGLGLPASWPIVLRIILLTAALFLLPSAVLGMISPIVVKLAVQDLAKTGSIVGRIYAAGAVGSIVGTFATGFFLISWFGTHTVVWGVAIVLITLGAVFYLSGAGENSRRGHIKKALLLLALLGVIGGSLLAKTQGWLASRCNLETNYFCIKVHEEEKDGQAVRVLVLDRMVHSYTSLDDPTRLVYGYEKVYAEAAAYQARNHTPLRALSVGGGGYTFPRYLEALYSNSQIDVIEIDPGVTLVAQELLGLRSDTTIITHNEDARMFLAGEPRQKYDLIMGDAFNDYSVPYHLTTREFNEHVHAWLSADGLYMVNLIDGPRRDFLRAYTNTLRQTFKHVYVVPAIRSWRESPRVTFVLIGTDTPLDLAAFDSIDAGDGVPSLARQVLSQAETDALLAEGRVALLTDQYAPVDQMLAPVFRHEEYSP